MEALTHWEGGDPTTAAPAGRGNGGARPGLTLLSMASMCLHGPQSARQYPSAALSQTVSLVAAHAHWAAYRLRGTTVCYCNDKTFVYRNAGCQNYPSGR